jgi:lysine-specific demethylase/histidyl-hydroxylase NO66
VARHLRRFIDELTPLGDGLAAPDPPDTLDRRRRVVKKAGTICQIHNDGDRVVIRFPGGHLRGPATTLPALRFIGAAVKPFRPGDLPGPLNLRSKQVLIRRLMREGLLELAERQGAGARGD